MSPIFVRPAREQDEHDRLVRHLEGKYRKKSDVGVNVRDEQTFPVKVGTNSYYPDLVLLGDNKKPIGVVEVESGESVNNLEAMAQWVPFARARMPFHLYVPVLAYDTARRLCDANHARVTEIWTYRGVPDGFDLVRMHQDPSAAAAQSQKPSQPAKPAKPVSKDMKPAPAAKPAAKPAVAPKPAKPVKPAAKSPAKKTKAKTAPPARKKPAMAPARAKKTAAARKPAKTKKR